MDLTPLTPLFIDFFFYIGYSYFMLFKVGDVLEYNNGMYGIITTVRDEGIFLDLSDGSDFILSRSQLMQGIANGNIKFKSFADGIKPRQWFYTTFKFSS